MYVDPKQTEPANIYKLLIGSITPRPIAFVSTVSKDGVNNLAPYSFFTGVSSNPPIIGFSPMVNREGRLRDSRLNAEAYEEFVVNVVSEDFAEQMNATAVDVPPEVDEFELSGLTPAPSKVVRPPRVKEARISMECKLFQIVEISRETLSGAFVMGEIVQFYIDDEVVDNFRIDPAKVNTVGRMGGLGYTRTRDRFEMPRPDLKSVMAALAGDE
ncbi:MAG: flavin reductase family protein [Gammaproteobacteria bacterium]